MNHYIVKSGKFNKTFSCLSYALEYIRDDWSFSDPVTVEAIEVKE